MSTFNIYLVCSELIYMHILWYAMSFLQKDQIIQHIEIKWLGFDYTLVQPKMFVISINGSVIIYKL